MNNQSYQNIYVIKVIKFSRKLIIYNNIIR